MTMWDGILTDDSIPVMVLGATNRPHALDVAIQRRLPRAFDVKLPLKPQREEILRVIMRSTKV